MNISKSLLFAAALLLAAPTAVSAQKPIERKTTSRQTVQKDSHPGKKMCKAIAKSTGERCKKWAMENEDYCKSHIWIAHPELRCKAFTQKGKRCCNVIVSNGYCNVHKNKHH